MKTEIITVLIAMGATLARQTEAQIYDTNNNFVQVFAGCTTKKLG